jgi:uncharacterized protein (DUF305 family)
MKKMIITITLFVLIALGFIMYRSLSEGKFEKMAKNKDASALVKAFINDMIPHHQEAVDSSLKIMNDLDITDPKVRIFAANVVDIQSFEISRMENIYREYLGGEYSSAAMTDGKDDHSNLAPSTGLKGDELAKSYAKMMIRHHQDAIDMAQDYIKAVDMLNKGQGGSKDGLIVTNSHPAIDGTYELAKQIVDSQAKEIEVMKGWYK